ncbi:hypothetical protein EDB86DRAFT_2948773, partial [Lactarius hatsudake]
MVDHIILDALPSSQQRRVSGNHVTEPVFKKLVAVGVQLGLSVKRQAGRFVRGRNLFKELEELFYPFMGAEEVVWGVIWLYGGYGTNHGKQHASYADVRAIMFTALASDANGNRHPLCEGSSPHSLPVRLQLLPRRCSPSALCPGQPTFLTSMPSALAAFPGATRNPSKDSKPRPTPVDPLSRCGGSDLFHPYLRDITVLVQGSGVPV